MNWEFLKTERSDLDQIIQVRKAKKQALKKEDDASKLAKKPKPPGRWFLPLVVASLNDLMRGERVITNQILENIFKSDCLFVYFIRRFLISFVGPNQIQ